MAEVLGQAVYPAGAASIRVGFPFSADGARSPRTSILKALGNYLLMDALKSSRHHEIELQSGTSLIRTPARCHATRASCEKHLIL